MSALQRKYFGKRRRRSVRASTPKRVVRTMARRRSFRRGGSRGILGGGMKNMLAPVLGGAADAIINPRSPINGIGSAATGFLLKDDVTMKIGLYQVGQSAAAFIPFIGAQAGGVASQV